MKKLACFDLDGTLFDTNIVNYCAYQQALSEEGFDIDKNYYITNCNGRHYTEFLPIITNNAENSIIERIHQRKKELYLSFLDKAIVNEALFEIIVGLRNIGYKTAVVTTASLKNTKDILTYYNKLKYFDELITSEDYQRKKPAPDSFLIAMEKFEVEPENTIVFEDSEVGIQAARASGATVFVVDTF